MTSLARCVIETLLPVEFSLDSEKNKHKRYYTDNVTTALQIKVLGGSGRPERDWSAERIEPGILTAEAPWTEWAVDGGYYAGLVGCAQPPRTGSIPAFFLAAVPRDSAVCYDSDT